MIPAELEAILKEAQGITADSREVREGYVFFAIRGTRFDGHEFVQEALKRGALAVVVERDVEAVQRVIKVENTRKTLAESAHLFYGRPSESLKVVGVTGTNGKTTTTYILESILKKSGSHAGLMGTIQYRLGDKVFGSGRTTPDPITWHRTLREMVGSGATHVVAEVSSHALDQYRVWGTEFEAVIFTNLTQDHLDYHRDMEDYFRAKARLFFDYKYRFAVVNTDDPYGKRLARDLGDRALTYGREGETLRIEDFKTGFDGSELRVSFKGKSFRFHSNLIGDFQAYNLSAALCYTLEVGIDPNAIQEALKDVHVPGRFEVHRSDRGFIAVVDYAHTPDAMDNVLRTMRRLTKNRVICVFGAGGNRDRGKRPLMGKSAEKWSDVVIITSDNPRDEEPERIIEDILKGVEDKGKVKVIPDRREAIAEALNIAKEGDIVAILGKGHEDYQEIKGVKYPFSDSEVLKKFL
ncbi:UDP-N-acetylmuramoyl-L-alanyl-D-glutamate--2,6-diaminopimelate ligase [Hydrogenivirga sp. 128-5-R1-1]|uniref:UDP-N-acetylmuramoyl-L-alanyl-D-glutamate--2, 6-diaminopimelate ligase n=1 Tax=Hydrogenivirga sp. 128-5-R1-1 TaxID=392423 RepID=UPI00015F3673|nr:UDP-N-acetylmuramoyl-L-alanyl-D-glutamate--2,6-diaminopimelate ligase [Hydrogenivirga sp. 128-5-R1-1]EDP76653.1 UDP-MurNac-tripeptide synthetase [Hydrogenivirga sp. 128-5-R1-1]